MEMKIGPTINPLSPSIYSHPFSLSMSFYLQTMSNLPMPLRDASLLLCFSIMGHNSHNHQHHHFLKFHLPHIGNKEATAEEPIVPPKGCLAVKVGRNGEEQQKFVVPVEYLNHPLFLSLLKEAEEEYGFDHKGAITIPCHVEYFRQVQGIIDHDTTTTSRGSSHHVHKHQHHPHLLTCFKA